MDRFKFRVWNNKIKEFVNPMDWSYWDLCFWYEPYKQDIEPVLIDMDYYEIEQCTGLKDKNGKLIYEGDIVVESFLGKTVVKWLDNKCGYNISKSFQYDDGRCKFESESWYEIIGNIHENKDLLEDK